MDKKVIIANWKMRLTHQKTLEVAEEFIKICPPLNKTEAVICPSFTSIGSVAQLIKDKNISLGAQDCFWEDSGAFTGEISPLDLVSLGCRYVIVGHSERRQFLHESDQTVNKKIKAAIKQGLIPVVCVGETFEERQEGKKDFIVMEQTAKAIEGLNLADNNRLIIAYEPVWVIGSGQAVDPAEAEHTHRVIRQVLIDQMEKASAVKIIYGGSVDAGNIHEFLNRQDVDGALVGGASLNPVEFCDLLQKVEE